MSVFVRYGQVPEVGRFNISLQESLNRSDPVVVRTQRGLELGELLRDWTPKPVEQTLSPERVAEELADL